jgi:hypothetical protein
MDLVTITCNRDFELSRLQAESIDKFLDPCTHWVFVNERFPNKKKWREMLEPYYTKHTLKLIFPKWYEYLFTIDGFRRHAAYKLLMVNYIDHDFVALDPKNFFVKPCNINEWKDIVGSGEIGWDSKWQAASERYAKKFNMPLVTDEMLLSECPFVYKIDLLKQLGDMNKFVKWYLADQSCETVLYSYLANHLVKNNFIHQMKHKTYWRMDPPLSVDELYHNLHYNQNIKMVGFHRFYLLKIPEQNLKDINQWLRVMGFKSQIARYSPGWFDRFVNKKILKELI